MSDLAELRKLSEAATLGPWIRFGVDDRTIAIMPAGRPGDICTFPYDGNSDGDGDFVFAAVNYVRALLVQTTPIPTPAAAEPERIDRWERALCEADGYDPDTYFLGESRCKAYRAIAREAIALANAEAAAQPAPDTTPAQPGRDINPAIRTVEPIKPVRVDYINYRGERSNRHILPNRIVFGSTEYHPEPQWLMEAYDLDKKAVRIFALENMRFHEDTTPAQPVPGEPDLDEIECHNCGAFCSIPAPRQGDATPAQLARDRQLARMRADATPAQPVSAAGSGYRVARPRLTRNVNRWSNRDDLRPNAPCRPEPHDDGGTLDPRRDIGR